MTYGTQYDARQGDGRKNVRVWKALTARTDVEQPVYFWVPSIAPSGMMFYTGDLFPAWKGSLFVGGHATNDLVRLSLDGEKVVGEERLFLSMGFNAASVESLSDDDLELLRHVAVVLAAYGLNVYTAAQRARSDT